MNASPALVRAVRGPLLLIALGLLLAVDHAGSAQFERTWPTLVIVFGLLKLLERAALRPERNLVAAAHPSEENLR